MSYEPDDNGIGVLVHRAPTQSVDLTDDELRLIGLARGRMKGACEDRPGNLCYGFVFEEDPGGKEIGLASEIGVVFGSDIDAVLPAIVKKLNPQLLITLLTDYRARARRASADPWIGTTEEWSNRVKVINLELASRGIHPYY